MNYEEKIRKIVNDLGRLFRVETLNARQDITIEDTTIFVFNFNNHTNITCRIDTNAIMNVDIKKIELHISNLCISQLLGNYK